VCWLRVVSCAEAASSLMLCSFTLLPFAPRRGARQIFKIPGGISIRPGSGGNGGTARVLRGASWNNNDPSNTLSAYRNRNIPGNRNDNNGFRCVLVAGGVVRKAKANMLARCGMGFWSVPPVPRGRLTVQTAPRPRGEKTRRRPWPVSVVRPSRPAFPRSGFQLAQPAAGHPAKLVNFTGDKDQLLLADPLAVVRQPPENAKLFEQQIELDQQGGFAIARRENGARKKQQTIERQAIQTLPEGKAMAFGKIGAAVERPT
jgi:hypothetical protein